MNKPRKNVSQGDDAIDSVDSLNLCARSKIVTTLKNDRKGI